MIRHPEFVWLSVSDLAREYNRHPESIRRWCISGFLIELGYTLQRDPTGHWIIGVPPSLYAQFSTKPTQQIDIR